MYFISITNKMQRYTIFFITVNALHVSGGSSAHRQELKNCKHSIGYMSILHAATASGSSKQAWSERANLYSRQTLILSRETNHMQNSWDPVICTGFPPVSSALRMDELFLKNGLDVEVSWKGPRDHQTSFSRI